MESQSQNLNEFSPWDEESRLENKSILILDEDNGAHEFAFVLILLKAIKGIKSATAIGNSKTTGEEVRVVLLLANNNRVHYEAILRKNVI